MLLWSFITYFLHKCPCQWHQSGCRGWRMWGGGPRHQFSVRLRARSLLRLEVWGSSPHFVTILQFMFNSGEQTKKEWSRGHKPFKDLFSINKFYFFQTTGKFGEWHIFFMVWLHTLIWMCNDAMKMRWRCWLVVEVLFYSQLIKDQTWL